MKVYSDLEVHSNFEESADSLAPNEFPLIDNPKYSDSIEMAKDEEGVMWLAMCLTASCYLVLTCFGAYNSYQYLYKQRRYLLYPLCLFYVFSLLTCATRLSRYIAMICAFVQGKQIYSLLSLLTNSLVSFFKVIVGFTQVITMQELTAGL